ncbi:MAG: IS30 family transposase [Rhodospirillales bacterium]|nr:IS30 family transposase [Rhodospirillales bacterium]MCB9964718.1 IS30 family transposase [Rhodospirillales bacterium]MCB9980058.1 IS30 family transposase [Rhodospirillales bacterium]
MAKDYTHLTAEERCQIYGLLQSGLSKTTIAKELGRHRTTIKREIERNACPDGYHFAGAQSKSAGRRQGASARPWKMNADLIARIEEKLALQWSSVQIAGRLAKEHGIKISPERIYQHIRADRKAGGALYKNLRHGGKRYKRRVGRTAGAWLIPNRVDIDHRPAVVDEKSRIGDWELDTVIGARQEGVIASMVERVSKYVMFAKTPGKTARDVGAALKKRLMPHKDKVLTLTADNGGEFAGHRNVAMNLEAAFFFAKPYHSWERGLNEHTNGLLRQYLPKGMSLANVTHEELDKIERLLNNRPRKALGFNTPQEIFSGARPHPPPRALHC